MPLSDLGDLRDLGDSMNDDSTICAVSTPPGKSGIGIVRLSGPRAIEIADKIFEPTAGKPLSTMPARRLVHGRVMEGSAAPVAVDEALASVMLAPHSYTTEDVVEINCHGGIVAVRRTLALMLDFGARLAEPGEFTRRAFLGGRLDLAQAEAVADLINAKTEAGLRAAASQLRGGLSERITALRDTLADCLAHIEATIDFPEDEVPNLPGAGVSEAIADVAARIEGLIESSEGGMLYRDGVSVAIVGKPNVGKSSILNAILDEPRAIVTREPGTTRDIIVESVDLHGLALRLSDTAGIRETGCEVERLGVERSEGAIEDADLAIFVADASGPISAEDVNIAEKLAGKKHVIIAANKSDLAPEADLSEFSTAMPGRKVVRTSALEAAGKTGIRELEEAIFEEVTGGAGFAPEEALVTRLRHRKSLEDAREFLAMAATAIEKELSAEFIAVDLREALDHLGEIVGAVVTDDLLNKIFDEFCIGK
jgi:tRNA modification GTPase